MQILRTPKGQIIKASEEKKDSTRSQGLQRESGRDYRYRMGAGNIRPIRWIREEFKALRLTTERRRGGKGVGGLKKPQSFKNGRASNTKLTIRKRGGTGKVLETGRTES